MEPTIRERLARMEADIAYIKENIAASKALEKRVSRLERLGAAGSALLGAFCFWVKFTFSR